MNNEQLQQKILQQQQQINSLQKQLNILSQDYYSNKGTLQTRFRNQVLLEAQAALGLFGATPIGRQSAITAPNAQGGSYNQTDVTTIVTAVNAIRTVLKAFGFIA
jgi:hypothetical protein